LVFFLTPRVNLKKCSVQTIRCHGQIADVIVHSFKSQCLERNIVAKYQEPGDENKIRDEAKQETKMKWKMK